MRYMLLIYNDEERWKQMSAQEKGAIFQEAVEFREDLRKSGVYRAGDPLHPTSTATTVRMKNGRTVMTDGPFAETKEQVGGILVLEARALNHAIQLMSKHPGVQAGPFEIRPAEDLTAMIRDSERRRSKTTDE